MVVQQPGVDSPFRQYPYRLYYLDTVDGQRDASGNYAAGASVWVDAGVCRDELAGSGSVLTLEDGSNYTASYVVYCPKAAGALLEEGMRVEVRGGVTPGVDSPRATGTIKRVYVGQLNVRLYI